MTRFRSHLPSLLTYAAICALYTAWMTAGSFSFTESKVFPNYNMLARAFLKCELHIQERGLEDCPVVGDKTYLYSGPAPALMRLPVLGALGSDVPTGLMVVVFVGGAGLLFIKMVGMLGSYNAASPNTLITVCFAAVFLANGYTLFMVTVPHLHHEAIASAAFFLVAAVYALLLIRNRGYRPSPGMALILGLSMSLCLASRFSHVFSVGFICLVIFFGVIRHYPPDSPGETARSLLLIFGPLGVTVAALLAYNYVRFGGVLDFGIDYIYSVVFGPYFAKGNMIRFDHIPLNLWSYLCRLPSIIPEFPYLLLPVYILKVESVAMQPYSLVNANELSVSLLLVTPIALLGMAPPALRWIGRNPLHKGAYAILFAVTGLQMLSTAITVATTARYYFDFLPFALAMGAIGALSLQRETRFAPILIVALAAVSIALSFAVPMNAISSFYARYIGFQSPLAPLFFAPGF